MADNVKTGDQPRASSKEIADTQRSPSLKYRTTNVKATKRAGRVPTRS